MAPKSILVINPNSTSSMTDGLKPLVAALGFTNVLSATPLSFLR